MQKKGSSGINTPQLHIVNSLMVKVIGREETEERNKVSRNRSRHKVVQVQHGTCRFSVVFVLEDSSIRLIREAASKVGAGISP